MEFFMDFFGGIIETILGERLNNKKQILCIGVNVSLLICFIVLTIVLFWQGYYLKGTVLALFDLLALVLFACGVQIKRKRRSR